MSTSVVVRVNGAPVDECQVALPLEIVHGRGSITSQPDAPTCSFTWLGDSIPAGLGDDLTIHELVNFTTALWADPDVMWDSPATLWGGDPAIEVPKFVGTVDTLAALERGGPVVQWEVGAVGVQAQYGYRPLNTSRPAETDTSRVTGIATAAGLPITIMGTAGVTVAAHVYEDADALSALHEVCASTGGLLWQARDGTIRYGTADHRDLIAPQPVDCEVIGDGLEWAQSTDSIVNHVTAKWAGGESTHEDTASVGEPWGVRHADVTTICAVEADAEQLALLILRRRSYPFWGTPAVVAYPDDMSPYQRSVFAALEVSAGVLLPFPIDYPAHVDSGPSTGIVEGWVETWDASGHTMQIAVGDAARWSGTTLRTWTAAATMTWGYWLGGNWMELLVKEPGDPV